MHTRHNGSLDSRTVVRSDQILDMYLKVSQDFTMDLIMRSEKKSQR